MATNNLRIFLPSLSASLGYSSLQGKTPNCSWCLSPGSAIGLFFTSSTFSCFLLFSNAQNPYLFILKYLCEQFKCTASREKYNLALALGNTSRGLSGKLMLLLFLLLHGPHQATKDFTFSSIDLPLSLYQTCSQKVV